MIRITHPITPPPPSPAYRTSRNSLPSLHHLSMSMNGMQSTSFSSWRNPFTEFFHQFGGYLCHHAPHTSDLTFILHPSKLQQ